MRRVTLYSRPGCHLCTEMRAVIEAVARELPLELDEVDIDTDPSLHARYDTTIPVLHVNGHEAFHHRVTVAALRARLATEPT
jgi:glutaredoxin